MKITEDIIKDNDTSWQQFTLTNDNHIEVSFLSHGGIISQIKTPDRNGKTENVVLGFKNYQDYMENPTFFGAIIGRVAGRIPNAAFTINDQAYQLTANEGNNHLHGGRNGFHRKLWGTTPFKTETSVGVRLSYKSPDQEEGYPGNLNVDISYELDNQNRFTITYHAETDKTTPLALTNHTYFNLSGNMKRSIENHSVTMESSRFAELDSDFIPTGNILPVSGTPFDFSNGRKVKEGINSDQNQNKVVGNGYDHYFLFDKNKQPDVQIHEPESGRTLTVTTDEPGMVMYTSNNLDDQLNLREGKSEKYAGLCLETQRHPAVLSYDNFPSINLTPEQEYHSKTTFTFGVKE